MRSFNHIFLLLIALVVFCAVNVAEGGTLKEWLKKHPDRVICQRGAPELSIQKNCAFPPQSKLHTNLDCRLPDCVTFEEAALLEPLSVGVHACRRANIEMGQSILVQGAGPIGTLCMMIAKAMGATQVVMTDLDQNRLALAKTLGADHVICVKGMSLLDVQEAVIDCSQCEPDATIECTGAQACMESSILSTRSGGVIVMVGLGAPRIDLPIIDSCLREVDIRGVFRYANCYPTALNLIASRRIDLTGLTKAHYKLNEAEEAFQRAQMVDVIKVFIHCQE
ncbi:unnamed protein product [Cylicocyclus nassatus]|uniref:Sorbitol dehydrogenase n=1 Tax=Cylicocyclus nassatus TaxID=53992 RepID=A0AA36MDZ7_CYLNA|nr:unnamed protein product [Cylicocyclus nassatus]